MSIQNEIDRIKENVASVYSAVDEMGGDLPETQNSAAMAAAVRSIPKGGDNPDVGILTVRVNVVPGTSQYSVENVTSRMEVLEYAIPEGVQGSDWTIRTDNNQIAITGDIAKDGEIKLVLGTNGAEMNGYSFGTNIPNPLGTASAGIAQTAARSDHVHPLPSAGNVGAAARDTVSEVWVSSTTYNAGDYCIWGDVLYRSKLASNINREPPNSTYWEPTSVGAELTGFASLPLAADAHAMTSYMMRYDRHTLNTPYKAGLAPNTEGLLILASNGTTSPFCTVITFPSGSKNIYMSAKIDSVWQDWTKVL